MLGEREVNSRVRGLLSKAKEAYRREGVYYVIHSINPLIYNLVFKNNYNKIYCKLRTHLRPPGTFTFQEQNYHYFYHQNGTTWKNERSVEVPIILEKIQTYRGGRILEVGNVLSNYVHFQHDIVDKYEKSDAVINQDVVYFQPAKKYDWSEPLRVDNELSNINSWREVYEKDEAALRPSIQDISSS